MHLTLISGMGFLDRIFFVFAFALNTQNVNYLHTKKKNHMECREKLKGME